MSVGDGLTLTTATLDDWTVNQPGYSQTLVPAGGTAPYSFEITDGDLPDGLTLDEQTGTITGTPGASGTFTFDVTITDGDGTEMTETLTLVINDAATIVTPEEPATGVEGVAYSQQLETEDGTGPFTWAVSEGELPPGLSLDTETGLISGVPTAGGEYTFTITTTDASGATTTETVTIEISDGLAIGTTDLDSWTVNQDGYDAALEAVGGTEPYQWQATGLPDGLNLNTETGEITGTPNQAGQFTVTVTVTDADGSTLTQQLTLVINEAPDITSPETLTTGVEGITYSEQLTVQDGTGAITWEMVSGQLPPGLTLDAETGQITGVPEETGTYTITVEATDETGATTTREFTITIGDGLTISTATVPEWTDGQLGYDEQLFAVGGTAPYEWTVTAGALPDGLTLSEDGKLTGTPTESGTFTFEITVTDADGTTSSQELTIVINDAPTISSPPELDSGVERVAYSEQLVAESGTEPHTWRVVSGELPPGLTLTDGGLLSGTPTKDGTYTFTVELTDATGAKTTQEHTIQIGARLSITTATLSGGEVTVPYGQRLETAGGAAPVSWDIADGTLPPGLSLNGETGEISGIPTEAGTFTVTVRATDSNGMTATRVIQITIEETAVPEEPPESPEEVPPETVEPEVELEEPVEDVGGIELVNARLETSPTNSINATSIVELRNTATEAKSVTVEHRTNGEVFEAQEATLGPGQSLVFRASNILRDPGSYRFSFTYVTEDRDRVQTRTLESDIGTVDIDEDEAGVVESPADDCELFGYGFGSFGLCWYWWVLIDGLIAMSVSYLVQTRVAGVKPFFAASAIGRHLERTRHAVPRLVAPWFAGALMALGVGIALYTAGFAPLVQFGAMALAAGLIGLVMGYLRVPDLAEPAE